jgi:hypothetical protein
VGEDAPVASRHGNVSRAISGRVVLVSVCAAVDKV